MLDTLVAERAGLGSRVSLARVAGSQDEDGQIAVVARDGEVVRARMAIAAEPLPAGEQVLVISDEEGSAFVIGTLGGGEKRASGPARRELVASDGTRVSLTRRQGSETVSVVSRTNRLILEFDSASEKLTLSVPPGGLEVQGQSADLAFMTSGTLRLRGGIVHIDSPGLVHLATSAAGQEDAGISLSRQRVNIESPELGVSAERGAFQVEHAIFKCRRAIAVIGAIRLVAEKIETTAESIFEKARNIYRSVEDLVQTNAGRMRTIVGQTYHLKAEKSVLRAKEIISLDADKIHLG